MNKQLKYYLSGPMTGLPAFNYPRFKEVARKLRQLGFTVVNPAELNHSKNRSWDDFMKTDIRAMMKCDAVIMIEGWSYSRGSLLESNLALSLHMQVIHLELMCEHEGITI